MPRKTKRKNKRRIRMAALASLRQMVKLAAQEIAQKLQVRQQRAIRSLEASRPNE